LDAEKAKEDPEKQAAGLIQRCANFQKKGSGRRESAERC